MKVAFAGTPEFAAVALRAILKAGYQVPVVLTQPDRPAGRGLKLQPSSVKQAAADAQVPVLQPRSLRLDGKWPDDAYAARDALQAIQPDVMVVAAYGLILPAWTLQLPTFGCLNIHASLLPRWRGAAPIHRAIEAGDAITGITVMQMDEGLDTGDMLLVEETRIGPDDTTASLHDRLAGLGGRLIVQALDQLRSGSLVAMPQPSEGVTYAHKIEKAEAAIDWQQPADLLERRIRAFEPFPGASLRDSDEVIKVRQARAMSMAAPESAAPGTVLQVDAQGVRVACGQGALELLMLQRPSSTRQPADMVARARAWAAGRLLS